MKLRQNPLMLFRASKDRIATPICMHVLLVLFTRIIYLMAIFSEDLGIRMTYLGMDGYGVAPARISVKIMNHALMEFD